ncbi:MAG: CHAD domain-containing protein [Oscillatoriales cyanobacterium C42_A2020_001]|nr:CHAD domain-containing protein [Leptolyngbyaceae cyanobacterium C42_A2020_001]
MKHSNHQKTQTPSITPSLTFGEYANAVIEEQYCSIIKREPKVLADESPEHLHQMRVGTRRLRTALQVFSAAIALPAIASEKQVGALARVLGELRDLDVQIADLQTTYRPQLKGKEKDLLDDTIRDLKKERRQVFVTVENTLQRSRYRNFKAAYEQWLDQPQFTPLAQLPIVTLLPDLLSPLLSELLLHPGWLVSANYASDAEGETLHNLRKAFKHVRYQAEFFAPFYGEPFRQWINEIKSLQEKLGKLQDSHVLQELLAAHLPKRAELPTLQKSIQHTRKDALADWDDIRQKYLDPAVRWQLHQMLLTPALLSHPTPDKNGLEPPAPAKTSAETSVKLLSNTQK